MINAGAKVLNDTFPESKHSSFILKIYTLLDTYKHSLIIMIRDFTSLKYYMTPLTLIKTTRMLSCFS